MPIELFFDKKLETFTMDNKEFYSKQNDISLTETLGIALLFIKITVGGSLLYMGGYLTFWAVGIIEQFINHPEKVPLINAILQSKVTAEVLKISTKGDAFIVENGLFFKWMILLAFLMTTKCTVIRMWPVFWQSHDLAYGPGLHPGN